MNDTFRIATWNIHGAVGLDRRRRPQRIVTVLDAINADIIALQEVPLGESMRRQLERDGRYHLIAAPTMTCRGEPFGNALLTRLPLIQSTLIDISVGGHEPRVLIDARLRAPNQSSLRILTTHCGLHADERRQQIDMLGALLAAAAADAEASVILGDFNEARTRSRQWHALDQHHAPHSPATFPAWLPLLALDRILISAELELKHLRIWRGDGSGWASDHRPLVAQLSNSPTQHVR